MREIARSIKISPQILIALAVILGIHSSAQAKNSTKVTFKPIYKVEKCDCLGFSNDIPTFLSDLMNGSPDVWGEGATRTDASRQARNMCEESYRNFASVSPTEDSTNITESGCRFFRSTRDGDWEQI